jgi:polynucleotide 5'-kinase involved in rRNA processing
MSNKIKVLIVGPKKSGKSGIANYLADPASFGKKTTNKTYLPTVRV